MTARQNKRRRGVTRCKTAWRRRVVSAIWRIKRTRAVARRVAGSARARGSNDNSGSVQHARRIPSFCMALARETAYCLAITCGIGRNMAVTNGGVGVSGDDGMVNDGAGGGGIDGFFFFFCVVRVVLCVSLRRSKNLYHC
jgi:hypothetical protein